MLVSSTTLSSIQILSSPHLLPAVKIKPYMFSKPLQSPAGTTLKGTLLFSEGERKCQGAGSADPWMSSAGHSSCPSLSYQGSANEACTAGIPPEDGGTWPLHPQSWSPGQGGYNSSPVQYLHFHSTACSSSRIPVPKKQRNSLNKWSKHSRLIISCKEQAQESTLAYHRAEIWPTSPACHWQAFFFSALHVGLVRVK